MKKSRKFAEKALCCLLAMVLLVGTSVHVVAEENTVIADTSEIDSFVSEFSDAESLSADEVESLVDYQIATYIRTESETENGEISAGPENTWVPLHDIAGNGFAHMVPLVDADGIETGYIIVSSIEDGYTHYLLSWDTGLLTACREELMGAPNTKVVFVPPLDFVLRVDDGERVRFLKIDMGDYSTSDISDAISKSVDDLAICYESIRSQTNAKSIENSLGNMELFRQGAISDAQLQGTADTYQLSDETEASLYGSTTVEDVRLKCEQNGGKSFVPVYSGSTKYYGGSQSWLDGGKKDNGCGPVAGANVMCYMAQSSSKYSNLYPYGNLSKSNFVHFMDTMYAYIDPSVIGEFSLKSWASDLKSWGKDRGVTLTAHTYPATYDKYTSAYVIKQALNLDKPIAALNLKTSYYDPEFADNFGWHWVTITKYYQGSSDNRWIALSSWGTRYSISWDPYWQATHDAVLASDGGYAYFE